MAAAGSAAGTTPGSGGRVVDAELTRGDFALTLALTAVAGQVLGILGRTARGNRPCSAGWPA